MSRIDKLVRMLLEDKDVRPVNGNGITQILRDRRIMKWLLLAGVTSISYRNGRFYDQFGREIQFYVVNGRYDFRILPR